MPSVKSADAKKSAEMEKVSMGAKLRKAHPWFDALLQGAKAAELKKRRVAERAKGPELDPAQVLATADELEELQRQINALEIRRKELGAALLAHWAHTGVEEIEHPLGKTLISTSFELALDQEVVRQSVSKPLWYKITERIVGAGKLLHAGDTSLPVRDVIVKAALVQRLKVSVTPPASRRPKSGMSEEEPGDGE